LGGGGDYRVALFGCQFDQNFRRDGSGNPIAGGASSTISVLERSTDRRVVLANCTVVSNYEGIVRAASYTDTAGTYYPLRCINCILAGDEGFRLDGDATRRACAELQRCTMSLGGADGFNGYGFQNSGGWMYTNTLAQALTLTDPHIGTNRFYSLTDTGGRSILPEANLDADPGFYGAGPDPYLPWWQRRSSAAYAGTIDKGLTRTTTYTFIDVNLNGAYEPLVDIIVDLNGQPHPGAGHFVYTTDLAGRPRFVHKAIDRGAYECDEPPAAGTIITFR
jgi:hypothetical protein